MADMRLQLVLQLREKVLAPLRGIQAGSKDAAAALKSTRDSLRTLEKTQQDLDGLRQTRVQLRGQQRDLAQLQGKLASTNTSLTEHRERHKNIAAALKTAREHHARLIATVQDGAQVTPVFAAQLEKARHALYANTQAYERSQAGIRQYRTQIKQAQTDVDRLTGRIGAGQERLQGYQQRLQAAGVSTARLGQQSRNYRGQIDLATAALERQKKALAALKVQQDRMAALKDQHGKAMMHTGMAVGAGVGMQMAGRQIARPVQATLGSFAQQEDASTQLRASMMLADGSVPQEFAEIDALAKRLGDRLPGTTADFVNMMTILRKEGISAKAVLGGTAEAAALMAVQLQMAPTEAAAFAAKIQDATQATEQEMLPLMDLLQKSAYLGADQNFQLGGMAKMTGAMSLLRQKGVEAYKSLSPLLVMMNQAGMEDGSSAGNAIDKVMKAGLDSKKLAKTNAMLKGQGIELNFADKNGKFAGIENLFAQLDKLKALGENDILRTKVLSELFGTDGENVQVLNNFMAKGFEGYKETVAKMEAQASLQQRVEQQLGTLTNVMDAAQGGFTNVMAAVGETVQGDAKGVINWIGEFTSGLGAWVKEHPVLTAGIVRTVAVLAALTAGLGVLLVPLALLVGKVMLMRFAFGLLGLKLPGIVAAVKGLSGVVLALGRALLMTPFGWFVAGAAGIAGAAYLIYKNWGGISSFFAGVGRSIATAVSGAWQSITGMLSRAWASIEAGARNLWQRLGGSFPAVLNTISQALVDWSPVGLFYRAFAAVMNYLGFDLPARFSEFGGNIVQGLVNGIINGAGLVGQAISNVASSAIGFFKEKLGIHSPSRVFMAAGVNVGEGAALGIDSTQAMVRKSAAGMVAAASMALPAAGMAAVDLAQPVAIDSRPALSAAAAPRPAPVVQGDTITIQIHAAPGMDHQALARAVSAELDRRDRAKAARAQASFFEMD